MSTEIGTLLVSSPDVCGGRLRIEGTRITVNQIAALYKQGYNAEEIAEQYAHLTMAQIFTALAHYLTNQSEIEADLAADKEETLANTNAATDLSKRKGRLEVFTELQRRLGLTSAKVAEWQDAARQARR